MWVSSVDLDASVSAEFILVADVYIEVCTVGCSVDYCCGCIIATIMVLLSPSYIVDVAASSDVGCAAVCGLYVWSTECVDHCVAAVCGTEGDDDRIVDWSGAYAV